MKITMVMKILVGLLLVGLFGISAFMYLFVQEHDYAVMLGNGYRYWGAKYERTIIDRDVLSSAESERVHEIWDEYSRKGIEVDPYDVGMPRVGPNVDGYRVYQGFITGHVSRPKTKPREGEQEPIIPRDSQELDKKLEMPGYFIIDTNVNRIHRGLSKEDWIKRLRKLGIDYEPKLFKPSKSDVRLGRNKPQSE